MAQQAVVFIIKHTIANSMSSWQHLYRHSSLSSCHGRYERAFRSCQEISCQRRLLTQLSSLQEPTVSRVRVTRGSSSTTPHDQPRQERRWSPHRARHNLLCWLSQPSQPHALRVRPVHPLNLPGFHFEELLQRRTNLFGKPSIVPGPDIVFFAAEGCRSRNAWSRRPQTII